jgi:hypothetical protein
VATTAHAAESIFNTCATLPLYKQDIAIKITKGTYVREKIIWFDMFCYLLNK